ncbi:hypothetical protein VTO42DRAFT_6823 [Malbranchea cinnamomea]
MAVGGALGRTADVSAGADVGKNVMIAGLGPQVVTMSVFMLLASDFAVSTWRRSRRLGEAAPEAPPLFPPEFLFVSAPSSAL